MTIWGTLIGGLRKKSKFKQHWIRPAGEKPKDPGTRQVVRAGLVRGWFESVSADNKGLLRAERRKLARAFAAGEFRQVRNRDKQAAA